MDEFLRRWYGSGIGHLVALTLGGIVGLYAAIKLVQVNPLGVVLFVAGAALIHDLVLVPAYTLVDRAGRRVLGPGADRPPAWWNYVRVPALLSALLLLVFSPLVFRLPENFEGITGTPVSVYSGRYVAVVVGLFAISGVAYLARTIVLRSQSKR